MKVALVTVAYNEERFIEPFLKHIPGWVNNVTVLLSAKPWYGRPEPTDKTYELASGTRAEVIQATWDSEEAQRNTGVELNQDCDWIIWLDPDEFLDDYNWDKLKGRLEDGRADSYVVEGQHTYWKDGWHAVPERDYQMLIATRPHVNFVDKRVVNSGYDVAPVWVHHFSWARTDAEVLKKITHYAHAEDFDTRKWYEEVWLKWKPGMKNVHPTTPETLHDFEKAELPPEIEELGLWPSSTTK
jgi:glycosyltransferase involved in cell wall biosynthesis